MNSGQAKKKSFLTPGWALALLVVVAFSYFAFSTLAPWQLGKNERTQATNARLVEASQVPPVDIASLLPVGAGAGQEPVMVPEDLEWRHVLLSGEFVDELTVVLRNRPVENTPAFHVITPLRLASGELVSVNRGWLAPASSGGVPSVPDAPVGEVQIGGYLRLDEPAPQSADAAGGVVEAEGVRLVNTLHSQTLASVGGQPRLGGYVQVDEDSAVAPLRAVALPQLESGPYLSYGIQWLVFGLLAPLILGWFVFAELRERRRESAELAELAGQTSPVAGTPVVAGQDGVGDVVGDEPQRPVSAEAGATQPAARYGKSRDRQQGIRQQGIRWKR